MDYGRTIEAYEGELGERRGRPATVQFLRVGRVALLYQTLDGKETGYWDRRPEAWVVDDELRAGGFKEAIAVAKKLGAPELLIVPVPAPKEVAVVMRARSSSSRSRCCHAARRRARRVAADHARRAARADRAERARRGSRPTRARAGVPASRDQQARAARRRASASATRAEARSTQLSAQFDANELRITELERAADAAPATSASCSA